MFKINVPITKSTRTNKNTLLIEGIASDPTIDRDQERFSDEAVAKMADFVNKGSIPIKVEHENKFYSEIGIWKTATMIGDKMHVTGEIDLNMSMGRDLEVMLNKGVEIGLSVGGKVLDSTIEYVKDLGKSIKMYTDVLLEEISIVKNPSNYSACLSIAKSFDADKKAETPEAQTLEATAKAMKKVDSSEFTGAFLLSYEKGCTSTKKKKDMIKAFEEVDAILIKDYDDCVANEVDYETGTNDLALIILISKVLQEVDMTSMKVPKEFQADDSWKMTDALPDESFVLNLSGRYLPHHNQDFTINKDWLKYGICRLLNGEFSWFTPKQFNIALSHLFHHYKQELMKKSTTAKTETAEVTTVKSVELTEADLSLMKSCYDFKVNKAGNRPQFEGNDLSDVEVAKMAGAYATMMQRKVSSRSLSASMANTYRTGISHSQPVAKSTETLQNNLLEAMTIEQAKKSEAEAQATAEVTTEAETVVENTEDGVDKGAARPVDAATDKNDMDAKAKAKPVKKEEGESTDGAEEVTTVTEEAGTDSSINKTGEVEVEATAEAVAETTAAESVETTVETTEVGETTVEETVKTTEEATVEEVAQVVAEETATMSTEEVTAEKSVEPAKVMDEAAQMAKMQEIATTIVNEVLAKSIMPMLETLTKNVNSLAETVSKSQETMTKSALAETDKFSAFEKATKDQAEIIAKLTNTVEIIGKSAGQRKSMSTFAAVEKAFTSTMEETTKEHTTEADATQALIHKAMDEGKSYAEARSFVLKNTLSQG